MKNFGAFKKKLNNLIIILVLVTTSTAQSVPALLTYQGRIVKSDGTPLEFNNVSFIFQITDPSGACVLYQEQVNGYDMTHSNGIFDTPIGSGSRSFPATGIFTVLDSFKNGATLSCQGGSSVTLPLHAGRLLRVSFWDGAGWRMLSPDSEIRSVPYAAFATGFTGILGGDVSGTQSATSVDRIKGIPVDLTGNAAGKVLGFDGTNWAPVTVSGGGGTGTVTSVTAGTGLDGGTISTTGTISIANGGVGATQLASNAVTTIKILDGNVTGAKLEDISGLTAGAYGSATSVPSITIDAKGRVTAISTNTISSPVPAASGASGQFLKSNGTIWAGSDIRFSDIKNSSGTSAFNTTSCTASQTVAWSSLTDMFQCQNIGSLNASAITAGTIDSARLPAGASMWQDGGSSRIYYNAGNVGIGTAAPNAKLEVTGGDISAGGNILLTAAGAKVSSSTTEMMLEQTGDIYGATRLMLRNRDGLNGAVFQNSGVDLVDFGFLPSSNVQGNIRFEHRTAQMVNSLNTTGEFKFMDPVANAGVGEPWFATGTNGSYVRGKLDVTGTVKSPEFCIGSSCITAWPSGGGGSGTVTSVIAGTGLDGGTISTTGTISISAGGVGATQLASNAVTTVKILDGAVTGNKLETISGLTAASYGSSTLIPSITVDAKGRITAISTNSVASPVPAASGASGKFLKSNGTSWSGSDIQFSDIKNSSGTSAFNTGSCGANQTVAWSSLTDMFQCQNIGSLDASTITAGTIASARLPAGASMWQDGGSSRIHYSAGNVGIGTATPASNLDVNGAAAVNSSFEGVGAYTNTTASYTIPDTSVNIRRLTLTAATSSVRLPAMTSPTGKMYSLTIFIKQDATGSRALSMLTAAGDSIKWDSGTAPTIATAANTVTILQFIKAADETVWYGSMVWKEN